MAQRLANVSKDFEASIGNLNFHAAYAPKAVRDTFRNKFVTLGEHLKTFSSMVMYLFLSL